MIKRDLKDNFQISISGQDTWYDMNVPGSAMETFCKEGILPDPYYGMNEYKWTEFWKNDFDIRSTFSVSAEEIASEEILLTFYGIDTVADVFLNGKKLGHTENMHRTWVYQVKELVKEGENLLELHIASPVKFIETYKPEKGREIHFTNTGTTSGSQYIRKAHSMFGWDWGPKLPDAGLFRGVELCCFDTARLGESLIRQEHMDGAVTLHIGSEIEKADGQVVKAGNTAMQSNGNSFDYSKFFGIFQIHFKLLTGQPGQTHHDSLINNKENHKTLKKVLFWQNIDNRVQDWIKKPTAIPRKEGFMKERKKLIKSEKKPHNPNKDRQEC